MASQLKSLLKTRRPLYNQANLHIAIKPEQTPEKIVTQIMCLLQVGLVDLEDIVQKQKNRSYLSHEKYYG